MTKPDELSIALNENDFELLYQISAPASGELRNQLRAFLLERNSGPTQSLPMKFVELIHDLLEAELEHGQVRNTALRVEFLTRRLNEAEAKQGRPAHKPHWPRAPRLGRS